MNLEGTIPLIHVYCDNWCERCPFTEKCVVFAREQAWRESKDSITDNDVFDYVEQSLSEALDTMLSIMDNTTDDAVVNANQIGDTQNPNPELVEELRQMEVAAKQYGMHSLKWMINRNTLFEGYRDNLLQQQDLGLIVNLAAVAELANAVEEIQWYAHFIGVKIHRIADQLQEPFNFNEIQCDANGSAKVVLIAIQRSIVGWEVMMRDFPEKLNEIITFLSILQRLQAVIQRLFPYSEQFHRPGFDD